MGYASIAGRAVANPNRPEAFGACDRCGFLYNLVRLKWQHQYAGTRLVNLRFLVCDTCLDEPQPQLKARMIPADPVPVRNPRPENYAAEENDTSDAIPTPPINATHPYKNICGNTIGYFFSLTAFARTT
jgi:hypothetical protein